MGTFKLINYSWMSQVIYLLASFWFLVCIWPGMVNIIPFLFLELRHAAHGYLSVECIYTHLFLGAED